MVDNVNPRRRSKRTATKPEAAVGPAPPTPPSGKSARDPIAADTLDEAFVKALEADFIVNRKRAIEAMRAEKPVEYVKIVAALRTKDTSGATDPLRTMSDADLDRHVEELARRAGYDIRRAASPPRVDEAADRGADSD